MKRLHIMITFVEPILGTANNNKNIHREFIASKAPDAISREEEVAAIGVDEVEEKSMTVFPRDENGEPIMWNYQMKGFMKEACGMLQRMKGEKCSKESCKLKAYKKIIDGCIEPAGDADHGRQILLRVQDGVQIDDFQRPLRAQTAQGERIALANSEILPEGTTAEFFVKTPDAYENAVLEWLRYGRDHGLGQWRNAGFGRFEFELVGSEDID